MRDGEVPPLLEWYEAEARGETVRGHTRYAALAAINFNVGVLLGMGHEPGELRRFLDDVLAVLVPMVSQMRSGATVGEALDSSLAASARSSLRLVPKPGGEGGA